MSWMSAPDNQRTSRCLDFPHACRSPSRTSQALVVEFAGETSIFVLKFLLDMHQFCRPEQMGNPPLHVMGPPRLADWLSEFRSCSNSQFEFQFHDISDPRLNDR
jgi:hypothetical protein